MPIPRVLVRLLRHHEQGPAGAIIAVRPAQADRLIADGLATPAPTDAGELPAPIDAGETAELAAAGTGRRAKRTRSR